MAQSVTSTYCACYVALPSGREASLPLQSVSAEVHIVDVLARVTLTHRFANPNRTDIPAYAKYVFPVPVGGAVCAFEMRTASGRVVFGEVKEASQAEAEYKEAVNTNKLAGLLAKSASDVFTMSLGAIPPNQAIKTTITYVIELVDDELLKQARFSLPSYVGVRYGTQPAGTFIQDTSSKFARFTLSADIHTTSAMERVGSPSHDVQVTMHNDENLVSRCSVVLGPSAGALLDKDFTLFIQASKLDHPRCVAEVLNNKPSVALSLTLVPRFGVQPVESQEYIFLIDRSGSMSCDNKMDYAKKALLVMLKSLPTTGTIFNIFSFGSSHSSLWPISLPYSQDSLSTALQGVESMEANMGGTELVSALESVLRSRTRAPVRPTSIFVLTDGEVWDVEPFLNTLRSSVAAAGNTFSNTYLRVFMLGIGNGASTALCHGLARAGNGLCLMTTQSEELAGKCARLLRASRVPPSGNLRNVRIDWGYTGPDSLLPAISKGKAKEQSIKPRVPLAAEKMFDEELDPLASGGDVGFPVDLSATTAVQQAPSVVPDFYPGNRFIVSAILLKTTRVPGSVILRGEAPDGTPMEFVFPVHVARFQKPWPPLVHTLAAHRIIQELDDGYVQCLGISTDVGPQHCKDIARSAIVRYSTEYQLASKYASFVAVEKDGTEATASSDDSDLELLSDADVDSEEWVSEFEKWDEPDCGEVNEAPSAGPYMPTRSGFSRAAHEAEQQKEAAQLVPRSMGTMYVLSQGRGSFRSPSHNKRGSIGIGCARPPRGMRGRGGSARGGWGCARGGRGSAHGGRGSGRGGRGGFGFGHAPALGRAAPTVFMNTEGSSSDENLGFGLHADDAYTSGSYASSSEDIQEPGEEPASHHKRRKHNAPGSDAFTSNNAACPPDDLVTAIARLQCFDGSFELGKALCKLVFGDKMSLKKLRKTMPASLRPHHPQAEKVWAAALAIAFLKTNAAGSMDVWAGLWEKARDYAARVLAGGSLSFDQVVPEAVKLL